MQASCDKLLHELLPVAHDEEIDFKYKMLKEDMQKMFEILKKERPKDGLQALEVYGSSANGLQLKGSSDLDMTLIVEDSNVNQYELLFSTGTLLQQLSDDGELPNIKVVNQKVEKRDFGAILDLVIVNSSNPE